MSIASGYKKFKKYILTSSGFQLVSHWTKANTLEFDDGKTAQDKLGAIDGISSSRESNSDKIAASTALVSELNSDLGGCQFGFTFDGLPGYKKVGADTVYPFKGWYYLGEGYSFDLKSFTDYSHFTIDNFIVGSSSAGASQSGGHGEFNTYAKINGFSLSKSYDNKLGILTINGYSQLAGCWDIDGYWRYTVTQNVKCFAYLIYK
ncbi:hypothetical protein SAMN05216405_5543 [Lachnospiraceae bacterium NLAE-zl-G231]|uniref:Uncharacterized protein n=1 Tax=Eisenbergiella tayi TaxID=1432052 RepID=A0A1E3AN56_9FIRM|nr:hypothetical protein [Eisenbergiella tayi]ODM09921.1 hypothetical protein BEH84_04289 [Eisenbergiella tayi]SFH77564.1 hypothetical protein SAMN05216405_5543 [Lachnospiraceae bacterium NLAE-zl-G231]